MKKSDLKTGMRVRTRDGQIYLVVCDVLINGAKDILLSSKYGWMNGVFYNDNLIGEGHDEDCFDIMEVYSIDKNQEHFAYGFMDLEKRHLIWKRQEYTDKQKEIFKALKALGFNWIARDYDKDSLMAYDVKPTKKCAYWAVSLCDYTCDIAYDFDFIKWKDEEPFEIPSL